MMMWRYIYVLKADEKFFPDEKNKYNLYTDLKNLHIYMIRTGLARLYIYSMVYL